MERSRFVAAEEWQRREKSRQLVFFEWWATRTTRVRLVPVVTSRGSHVATKRIKTSPLIRLVNWELVVSSISGVNFTRSIEGNKCAQRFIK
jgi:hypothetical protein